MARPVQDTIEFSLIAEETVVNNTVKVIASIVGITPTDMAEPDLRATIRNLMRKFIDTDWQFSNWVRTPHPSGQEQISLGATARVSEEENRALDRRREDASRDSQGIRITGVTTDTSPTPDQIQQTQRNLRLALLRKAQEEVQVINGSLGETPYRLGSIKFGPVRDQNQRGHAMMASAPSNTLYGSGFGDDDSIGNAVKISMQADVELRISR